MPRRSTSRCSGCPAPESTASLVEPDGGVTIRRRRWGTLSWPRSYARPHVGDAAVASETLMLASTVGNMAALDDVERRLDQVVLRHSVVDPLAVNVPSSVTCPRSPKLCLSRTCGAGSSTLRGGGVGAALEERRDPLHPCRGVRGRRTWRRASNRWTQEWKLSTWPGTFLVGADGKIASAVRRERSRRASSSRLSARSLMLRVDTCRRGARRRCSGSTRHRAQPQHGTYERDDVVGPEETAGPSSGVPVHAVILVATKPGYTAVARTPCWASLLVNRAGRG